VVLNEILNAFFVVFQESVKVEPHLSLSLFFGAGPVICVLMTELLSHAFRNHVRHIQVFTAVSAQFVVHWSSFGTLASSHEIAWCHTLEDHNLKFITVQES
jgi:hypothetical protein